MRTKIIIAITACLFAVVSVANMHLAQNYHNMDVSLADISVMAQADGENGGCESGTWGTGNLYWKYTLGGQPRWICCDASHSLPCCYDPDCDENE